MLSRRTILQGIAAGAGTAEANITAPMVVAFLLTTSGRPGEPQVVTSTNSELSGPEAIGTIDGQLIHGGHGLPSITATRPLV